VLTPCAGGVILRVSGVECLELAGKAEGPYKVDAPDGHESLKAERAKRRRLYELRETQRWVHHVADLDSGETLTTPLARPLTPLSRAERLSQLGHRLDPTIFDGPAQRLTPRHLYNPAPAAWLSATNASSYDPAGEPDGVIWWDPPRAFEPPAFFGLYVFFAVAPAGLSLASISLDGYAFEGAHGLILLRAYGTQGHGFLSVPVDRSFGVHTVDFTFVPPAAPQPLEIVMELTPGIEDMLFTGISLAAAPIVVDPGPVFDPDGPGIDDA
jgi:hypothetical protein